MQDRKAERIDPAKTSQPERWAATLGNGEVSSRPQVLVEKAFLAPGLLRYSTRRNDNRPSGAVRRGRWSPATTSKTSNRRGA